jgi:hypothetical protein
MNLQFELKFRCSLQRNKHQTFYNFLRRIMKGNKLKEYRNPMRRDGHLSEKLIKMFVQRTHKQFAGPEGFLQNFRTLNCTRRAFSFRYAISLVRSAHWPLSTLRMSDELKQKVIFLQTIGQKSSGPGNHSFSSELHRRLQEVCIKRFLSVLKLTIYVHKQTDKSTSCSYIW